MSSSDGNGWISRLKRWAKTLQRDVLALWIAARDPHVPWHAKAAFALICAYALSPIDLIPDFIPVLGYLDELILLPFAIMPAVRLAPADLMEAFRSQAERLSNRPVSRVGAVVIVALWIAAAGALVWAFAVPSELRHR